MDLGTTRIMENNNNNDNKTQGIIAFAIGAALLATV